MLENTKKADICNLKRNVEVNTNKRSTSISKTRKFFMMGFYLDRYFFLVWLHSFKNLGDLFWQWICEGCKLRDANVDVTHCGEGRRSKFTATARARFIQIDNLQNCYKARQGCCRSRGFLSTLHLFVVVFVFVFVCSICICICMMVS